MEIANTCSRNVMAPSQPTWTGATTMKLPQIAAALTCSEDLQPPQTAAAVKEKRLDPKVELMQINMHTRLYSFTSKDTPDNRSMSIFPLNVHFQFMGCKSNGTSFHK